MIKVDVIVMEFHGFQTISLVLFPEVLFPMAVILKVRNKMPSMSCCHLFLLRVLTFWGTELARHGPKSAHSGALCKTEVLQLLSILL